MNISKQVQSVYKSTKDGIETHYDSEFHLQYEIIYVANGNAEINIEGEIYSLTKNSYIIIAPMKYHTVSGKTGEYKRLLVQFSTDFIPQPILRKFDQSISLNPVGQYIETLNMLQQMADLTDKNDPDTFGELFKSLLMQLIYFHSYLDISSAKTNTHNELVGNIVKIVDKYIESPISLSSISSECFSSVSTVCHAFKNVMNISLKAYIIKKKMYHAIKLINEGLSATDTAKRCGYENYASFYKAFKQETGCSPSETQSKLI